MTARRLNKMMKIQTSPPLTLQYLSASGALFPFMLRYRSMSGIFDAGGIF